MILKYAFLASIKRCLIRNNIEAGIALTLFITFILVIALTLLRHFPSLMIGSEAKGYQRQCEIPFNHNFEHSSSPG